MKEFRDIYRGKRVLITGNTGFKGSWLSVWLLELGAEVTGYSIGLPSDPSNFEVLGLKNKINHIKGDVRDFKQLMQVFNDISPDLVFHLAAQPLTRLSYNIPQETFLTNLGGTVNLLECLRNSQSVRAAVIITSDKCYKNVEWVWGYRENDLLGGDDPYSASKACAEIACNSYIKSFFSRHPSLYVSTARAGNVIGGGDWALDRIVPDCVRAFSKGDKIRIRNPKSTRPWQHVLEPLGGYLWLGANLLQNGNKISGESYNFGPGGDVNRTVEELLEYISNEWGKEKGYIIETNDSQKMESTLLKLNCDKVLHDLRWRAILSFEETIKMTCNWYHRYYDHKNDMYNFSSSQIQEYVNLAQNKGLEWAL